LFQREPEQAVQVIQPRSRAFALEHRDLLAQGQNLQPEIMACVNEGAQVSEKREHAVTAIVSLRRSLFAGALDNHAVMSSRSQNPARLGESNGGWQQ
jgi:small-conductance mechanosensitive channel